MTNLLWQRVGLIVAGAVLLLWAPAVNGYPFIFTDTGTYLWSSVRFEVSQDRPIGYSLVLRAVDTANPVRYPRTAAPDASRRELIANSLPNSLWGVIAFQAFGASYLLVTLAEIVLEKVRRRALWILVILGLTTLTTAVSIYAGAIMPDILTGWLFLGACVFFAALNRIDRGLGAACFAIAVFAHNSHVPLALVMLIFIAVSVIAVPRLRARYLKQVAQLGGVLAAVLVSILLVNAALGAGLVLGRGTSTFLLNRFAEAGVLTKTLAADCATNNWQLCAYRAPIAAHRGELSWYLYGEGNPSDQVGWDKGIPEQQTVVQHALQCCLSDIAVTSAAESWKQFWTISMAGNYVYLDDHWNAVLAIKSLYPNELPAFQASTQQSKQPIISHLLPFDEQASQLIFLALGLCLLIVTVWARSALSAALLASGFFFLIFNAMITGAVGHAEGRYQGRIFWLIPFLVWLIGVALVQGRMVRRRTVNSG